MPISALIVPVLMSVAMAEEAPITEFGNLLTGRAAAWRSGSSTLAVPR